MKAALITALLLLLATAAGWIIFSTSPGKATITIDAQEAGEDTKEAIEAGKELLKKAKDNAEQSDGAGE
jgi:hypothetical protein